MYLDNWMTRSQNSDSTQTDMETVLYLLCAFGMKKLVIFTRATTNRRGADNCSDVKIIGNIRTKRTHDQSHGGSDECHRGTDQRCESADMRPIGTDERQ